MKSIIIPTLGKCEEYLKPLINSIIEYTDLNDLEIIIVSNGSKDNTDEYVASLGAPFKLLTNPEPMGYTAATNWGVKESKGDIVILMNNDVLLLPQPKNQWLEYLCTPLKDNIGITCNLKIWDASVERMFAVAFLMAFPRHIWDKIGGFDEATWSPGGGEDIEFCLQVEQLGYKIIQVPDEQNIIQNGINVNRFPSYHVGEGTMMDSEHKEGWVPHIAKIRALLEYKYKLPEGWFYGEDINEYRQLIEDVPEGGTIGELGCYKGRSLCSVADIIKRKKLKVVVVDIFTGTDHELKESNYRLVFETNMERFGIRDQITVHEGYTKDVVKGFIDNYFDLLFIDASHLYEDVKQDIEMWLSKIKKNGKIAGHDYGNHIGVSQAVNEKFSNVRINQLQFEIYSGIATSSIWSKRL